MTDFDTHLERARHDGIRERRYRHLSRLPVWGWAWGFVTGVALWNVVAQIPSGWGRVWVGVLLVGTWWVAR